MIDNFIIKITLKTEKTVLLAELVWRKDDVLVLRNVINDNKWNQLYLSLSLCLKIVESISMTSEEELLEYNKHIIKSIKEGCASTSCVCGDIEKEINNSSITESKLNSPVKDKIENLIADTTCENKNFIDNNDKIYNYKNIEVLKENSTDKGKTNKEFKSHLQVNKNIKSDKVNEKKQNTRIIDEVANIKDEIQHRVNDKTRIEDNTSLDRDNEIKKSDVSSTLIKSPVISKSPNLENKKIERAYTKEITHTVRKQDTVKEALTTKPVDKINDKGNGVIKSKPKPIEGNSWSDVNNMFKKESGNKANFSKQYSQTKYTSSGKDDTIKKASELSISTKNEMKTKEDVSSSSSKYTRYKNDREAENKSCNVFIESDSKNNDVKSVSSDKEVKVMPTNKYSKHVVSYKNKSSTEEGKMDSSKYIITKKDTSSSTSETSERTKPTKFTVTLGFKNKKYDTVRKFINKCRDVISEDTYSKTWGKSQGDSIVDVGKELFAKYIANKLGK